MGEGIKRDRGYHPRPGFTLLELVLVIFLVSLLAALIFPSFSRWGDRGLEHDARRVASILRYLNDTAISSKETCSLKVDLKEQVISWRGPDGERKESFPGLFSIVLQSKGEVKEGEVILFFGPLGIQEAIAIRLRAGEKGMRVAFHPLSGKAKIVWEAE
ncbi:MAG: prepilin-type N-terminal cleavage/methylation domain-containing protein [candidate division NC10 bacterium]|nr:prepilin-type N-terminal cleavage/methylation domain-containing protein [candidate division NC10 bacterium]